MQTGVGLPGTSAKAAAQGRCLSTIAVLLLGLAVSACVGTGQIANLTETARPSVAFESIDGAPAAVIPRFVTILEEEAVQQRLAVGSPGEVNYRLHGSLAARSDGAARTMSADAKPDATVIAWTLDVYDGDQHRLIRLSGEEKVAGRAWASADDDQALRRIARAGMDQVAAFLATTRTPAVGTVTAAPPKTAWGTGWLDDWAPEASGIFRNFGREPSTPAAVAEARGHAPADDVPLPRGRPTAAGAPSGTAVTLATANPAEKTR